MWEVLEDIINFTMLCVCGIAFISACELKMPLAAAVCLLIVVSTVQSIVDDL